MIWSPDFDTRLDAWYHFRQSCALIPHDREFLLAVNDWWFMSPMVNTSIQWSQLPNWPDPWQLLKQSGFCDLARCLGIVYTIQMIDRDRFQDIQVIQTDLANLVSVQQGKYILNWSPDTLLNIQSDPLSVLRSIDMHTFSKTF